MLSGRCVDAEWTLCPGAVRAQVQLMMRKQGSLYLASLVCASLSDSLSARAAASRFGMILPTRTRD